MINSSFLTRIQSQSLEPENLPLEGGDLEDLSDLPLIPLPNELKQLLPLPKEQEKVLRLLARHAIQLIKENIKNGTLQTLTKGFKV